MNKRITNKHADEGVSPVVGVMLMLVVTIIIAAVVSGFAGGLASGTEKAPTLTMDVSIKNTGYAASSYVLFNVQAVSDPIPTDDLKISTVWTVMNMDGARITGGNTVVAGEENTDYHSGSSHYVYNSPLGFGKGLDGSQRTSGQYGSNQWFGNFTLVPGTTMKNSAGGYSTSGYGGVEPYVYEVGTYWQDGDTDGMMAIIGENWNELRPGDLVDIKITHIPSGKLIFDTTVGVEG